MQRCFARLVDACAAMLELSVAVSVRASRGGTGACLRGKFISRECWDMRTACMQSSKPPAIFSLDSNAYLCPVHLTDTDVLVSSRSCPDLTSHTQQQRPLRAPPLQSSLPLPPPPSAPSHLQPHNPSLPLKSRSSLRRHSSRPHQCPSLHARTPLQGLPQRYCSLLTEGVREIMSGFSQSSLSVARRSGVLIEVREVWKIERGVRGVACEGMVGSELFGRRRE